MPCLNLSTNVSLIGVDTSSILSEATSTVATLIGKPEAYAMIVLKGSIPISFSGTEQPAAHGELVSIGGLSSDVKKKVLQFPQFLRPSCLFLSHGSSSNSDTKAHQSQEYA
ncbi:Macrophage migration inhibitory factor [Quillaja saponaria]|uniref:Macrophage migration inhibitory factor n=1 Tax=Quillaja saponaria TaxID=32244 RepID=A0AAD7LN13_QUISA|nr:Macrophage migration inhibitory factor [Quillaja saponaria]